MRRAGHPLTYEINTVSWLYELGRKGGALTLAEVPDAEWDRLKLMGFDYVWLMGVWRRSPLGVSIFRQEEEFRDFSRLFDEVLPGWGGEDLVGAPYSIAAYEPDPMVGGWAGIDAVRKELNVRGMGLLLDFVPNHTAPDHPWASTHPDYYINGTEEDSRASAALFTRLEAAGGQSRFVARGRDPYFAPWTDTIQLNYYNSETRLGMLDTLREISRHAEGVRCDMAMLVLNDIFHGTWGRLLDRQGWPRPAREFWEQAREALPGFLLVAEAYWDTEWRLQQMGFDYAYDKRLYDRLKGGSAADVRGHLRADPAYQGKLVRFIENHDEQRSARAFSPGALRASALLVATLPGMRLFHHGQFEGRKIKAPIQLRRVIKEPADAELAVFYKRLLGVLRLGVLKNGTWRINEVLPHSDGTSREIVSYSWRKAGGFVLIVINLSGGRAQGLVQLNGQIKEDAEYRFQDKLSGENFRRSGADLLQRGLHVILEGFKAHVLNISPARGGK